MIGAIFLLMTSPFPLFLFVLAIGMALVADWAEGRKRRRQDAAGTKDRLGPGL